MIEDPVTKHFISKTFRNEDLRTRIQKQNALQNTTPNRHNAL